MLRSRFYDIMIKRIDIKNYTPKRGMLFVGVTVVVCLDSITTFIAGIVYLYQILLF